MTAAVDFPLFLGAGGRDRRALKSRVVGDVALRRPFVWNTTRRPRTGCVPNKKARGVTPFSLKLFLLIAVTNCGPLGGQILDQTFDLFQSLFGVIG